MIPPIPTLRALISLSKTASITQTAKAMNLTQSAISHQMKTLEKTLGFAVLHREGRTVRLTHRARQYAAEIAPALKTLADANATTALSGTLALNVAPGFAASWLVKRLHTFNASHPNLGITLNTPRGYGDLGQRDDDLYISFLPKDLAPQGAHHLMSISFFPVAAPSLTAGREINGAEDLLDYPLLHLDGASDWAAWMASAGSTQSLPHPGLVFQDMQIMAAAARAGQGIALGDELTSQADLNAGDLIRLHSGTWPSSRSYWLIKGDTADNDARDAFIAWILSEFRT